MAGSHLLLARDKHRNTLKLPRRPPQEQEQERRRCTSNYVIFRADNKILQLHATRSPPSPPPPSSYSNVASIRICLLPIHLITRIARSILATHITRQDVQPASRPA
jgi:hypothetical protein